nr:uncharacterized protein LOC117866189 [Setaria viridis]
MTASTSRQGCRGGTWGRPWQYQRCLGSPVQNAMIRSHVPLRGGYGVWSGLPCPTFSSITCFRIERAMVSASWRLPALRVLKLKVDNKDIGILTGFVVGAGAFPCLISCEFYQFVWLVVFQHGAMPRLRNLRFRLFYLREARGIAWNDGSLDLGLGNLPSLQDVKAYLRCDGAGKEEAEEAKAALTHEAKMHPNHPVIRSIFFPDDDDDDDSYTDDD